MSVFLRITEFLSFKVFQSKYLFRIRSTDPLNSLLFQSFNSIKINCKDAFLKMEYWSHFFLIFQMNFAWFFRIVFADFTVFFFFSTVAFYRLENWNECLFVGCWWLVRSFLWIGWELSRNKFSHFSAKQNLKTAFKKTLSSLKITLQSIASTQSLEKTK